jgi:DNA polymerase-3 subunit delta'
MEISEIQPELAAHFQQLVTRERLSHAYLFLGGFGNFEMAIWLAKAIFCPEIENGLPCRICRVCRLIDENEFSDLHLVEPVGLTIKVEQIRDLLETFATTGFESNKKVIIIKEAEKMGVSAANSLLKSLEEPERETFIFLLANDENQLLPTIRSRTQKVVFPRNIAYMKGLLKGRPLSEVEADLLAELTALPDQTLQLADSSWFPEAVSQLIDFVGAAQRTPDAALLKLPELIGLFEDKKQQDIALSLLLILFNRANALELTARTFDAQKMWRANVRFQSALEYLLL